MSKKPVYCMTGFFVPFNKSATEDAKTVLTFALL